MLRCFRARDLARAVASFRSESETEEQISLFARIRDRIR